MSRAHSELDQRAMRPRLLDRIELCGYLHPVTLATPHRVEVAEAGIGEDQTCFAYRCRSYWCEECAALHRRKFERAAAALFREARRPVLCTLTHKNRHRISILHEDGAVYSTAEARRAVESLRDHWRRATHLLRDVANRYERARTDRGKAAALALLPSPDALQMTKRARRKYAKTYKKGAWIGATSKRDWINVLELATGGQWYHAHFHVVVRNRALAEALNVAWQITRQDGDPLCQTRIDRHDVGQTPEDFARYVSKYISKPYTFSKEDGEGVSEQRRLAVTAGVIRAFHRQRRVNGSGTWRNLGLRRARTGETRLLMWHPIGSTADEIAEREATAAPDGLPATWHREGWRKSHARLALHYRLNGLPVVPRWRSKALGTSEPPPAQGPGGRAALMTPAREARSMPAPQAMAASAARILDCQNAQSARIDAQRAPATVETYQLRLSNAFLDVECQHPPPS